MSGKANGANRLMVQIQSLGNAQHGMAVAILGLVGLFYFSAYRPQQTRIAELERQSAVKRTELDSDRLQTDRLPRVTIELESLKRRLADFKKLPDDPQVGQFLHEINQISQQAGLQQLKIEPGLAHRSDLFTEQSIVLGFKGSFSSVAVFIRRLEDMERLTRLRDLSIHQIDAADGSVDVKLSVNIYYGQVQAVSAGGS